MRGVGEMLLQATQWPSDEFRAGRNEYGDAPPAPAELTAELGRRDADLGILRLCGDLSQGSVGAAADAVSKALVDVGRVVVDLSGVRLTWLPAAQVFPSTLAALGGWPRTRLVLFGADRELVRSLTTLRLTDTVPLATDETAARRLLECRPPAVARQLDIDEEPSASRRARLFVRAACQEWQLDAACDDAVLVASELVGNAAMHARTSCRLGVRLDALGLTIAVRDYDCRGLLNPLACTSTGRREHGLFLVASISRAWGVSTTENGKIVWAILPVTA